MIYVEEMSYSFLKTRTYIYIYIIRNIMNRISISELITLICRSQNLSRRIKSYILWEKEINSYTSKSICLLLSYST